jgi:hypothetical protein
MAQNTMNIGIDPELLVAGIDLAGFVGILLIVVTGGALWLWVGTLAAFADFTIRRKTENSAAIETRLVEAKHGVHNR